MIVTIVDPALVGRRLDGVLVRPDQPVDLPAPVAHALVASGRAVRVDGPPTTGVADPRLAWRTR